MSARERYDFDEKAGHYPMCPAHPANAICVCRELAEQRGDAPRAPEHLPPAPEKPFHPVRCSRCGLLRVRAAEYVFHQAECLAMWVPV